MEIDAAMLLISVQLCPMDGLKTEQQVQLNGTLYVWEQCPQGHTWPLRNDGGDKWSPDVYWTEQRLREYRGHD